MKIGEITKELRDFAYKHNLHFADGRDSEVGFGRPCVGFLKGSNYIDYCPINMRAIQRRDFDNVEISDPPGLQDYRLRPPSKTVPDAYHKTDCMAVLIKGRTFNKETNETEIPKGHRHEALRQLHAWVRHLLAIGDVEFVTYRTGATGMQIFVSGVNGTAIRFKEHDG